jgi:hypothetical protein
VLKGRLPAQEALTLPIVISQARHRFPKRRDCLTTNPMPGCSGNARRHRGSCHAHRYTRFGLSSSADDELLTELKTRARIRLNALRRGEAEVMSYARWIAVRRRWKLPEQWRLHHALNLVAAAVGFRDWSHAHRVLSGRAPTGTDMGGLWYDYRCQLLLNHWFARYDEAQAFIAQSPDHWLFPFGTQFVVGEAAFVRQLGLDPDSPLLRDPQRDVHSIYGTARWRSLCALRLTATRTTPLQPRHL